VSVCSFKLQASASSGLVWLSVDASTMKTICIIGAGAGGLAALRAILDSPQYKAGLWNPTVFEARHQVGGIWSSLFNVLLWASVSSSAF
jgi:hypothetical protein